MSDASNQIRSPESGMAWMLWPVRLLSLVALGIAGYLFFSHLSGSPIAGCDPTSGFDCDAALSSRWASWLGVPVLWVGVVCYVAIFVSSWGLARNYDGLSSASWRVFVAAVCIAAGAGMWFLGLQLTGQSSICPYCIGIHSCGLTIATFVGIYLIRSRLWERSHPAPANVSNLRAAFGARSAPVRPQISKIGLPSMTLSYGGAILALAALAGGQILYVPPQYLVSKGQLDEQIDLSSTSTLPPATNSSKAVPADSEDNLGDKVSPAASDDSAATGEDKIHETRKVNPDGEPVNSNSSETTDPIAELVESRPKKGSRTVELLGGKLKLDTYEHPVLGNPDAEHIIVEFFDYTCPHCRTTHKYVAESLPRYGNQLAIVMLPVPNDILCNRFVQRRGENHRGACKLASLAVATAAVDPAAYIKLHDWIMDQEKVPNYFSSMGRVQKYTDQSKVLKELSGDEVSARVQRYIELFASLGASQKVTLPTQIIGDEIVSGAPASAKELRELWESKLGIKPKAGQGLKLP